MATKDAAYWAARQQELWDSLEKDEKLLLQKLDKRYDEMLDGIDKEISAYFAKYGRDNVLEYSTLLQVSDAADKDKIIRFWDDFAAENPEYAHLGPTRESVYKMTRLQSLQDSILREQVKAGTLTKSLMEKHLVSTGMKGIKLGYDAAGKIELFNSINPRTMQMLVNSDWTGTGDFSSKVWGDTTKLHTFMGRDFTQGVVRGDSYNDIINQLRTKYAGVTKSNARRLVYTEGTFVLNESLARGFESNFEEYEYSAHLDSKTSDVCRDLNGKIFRFDQRKPGENFPPMHPRCRSSFLTVIPEEGAGAVAPKTPAPPTPPPAPPIASVNETKIKDAFEKAVAKEGYFSPRLSGIDPDARKLIEAEKKAAGGDWTSYIRGKGYPTYTDAYTAATATTKAACDRMVAKTGWVDTSMVHLRAKVSPEELTAITRAKEMSGKTWSRFLGDMGYSTVKPGKVATAAKAIPKTTAGLTDIHVGKYVVKPSEHGILADAISAKPKAYYWTEWMDKFDTATEKPDIYDALRGVRTRAVLSGETGVEFPDIARAMGLILEPPNLDEMVERTVKGFHKRGITAISPGDLKYRLVSGSREDVEAIMAFEKYAGEDLDDALSASYAKVMAKLSGGKTTVKSNAPKYPVQPLPDVKNRPETLMSLESVTKPRRSAIANHGPIDDAIKESAKLFGLPDTWLDDMMREMLATAAPVTRRRSLETLVDIATNGLKTQFSTGTSGGCMNTTARMKLSQQIFGHSIPESEGLLFEKYGYWTVSDPLKESGYGATGYGKHIIKWKRDAVMERATITIGDSLNNRYYRLVGNHVYDADMLSCMGSDLDDMPNHVRSLARYYSSVVNAGTEIDPNKVATACGLEYTELQLHGKITPDMIEEILIESKWQNMPEVKKIIAAGVKVTFF